MDKSILPRMRSLTLIFLCLSAIIQGQNKYLTKSGIIIFEASISGFEEVKAVNKTVTSVLNTDTGEMAVLALIKGFRFKNALMEEHFNENYIQSHKFPKAIFRGKISDFNLHGTTFGLYGTLEMNGVSKPISCELTVIDQKSSLQINGTFKVLASDYNIEIPKTVLSKVSNDVDIDFDFVLTKKSD